MPEKGLNPKKEDIDAAMKSATRDMVNHFISPTLIDEIVTCKQEMTPSEIINTYVGQGWTYLCSEKSPANLDTYLIKGNETKFILHRKAFLVFQRKAEEKK